MVQNLPQQSLTSSDDLWTDVVKQGVEVRVEVNQRMLIDKMLSRYSSDFVPYRELIQNSDDAEATSFILKIVCDSSTMVNEKQNFHGCTITEIRAINNGKIFDDDDWQRVITIAEGNHNVDAIGQFGVGFFSVFSYSERPMIQSGKYCLAFVWQNEKSLTTFRKELSIDQQSSFTSIILPMRNQYILEIDDHRSVTSKNSHTIDHIVPILDLIQLKAYFIKVLSFTRHITEVSIEINDQRVFQVTKTKRSLPSIGFQLPQRYEISTKRRSLFHLKSIIQTEKNFQLMDESSITLNHIDVEAAVEIDEDLHLKMQGIIKKRLPSVIHIQFLYSLKMISSSNVSCQTSIALDKLVPMKHHEGKILPTGQIFIGLSTHQTTGIGMHVFTHLIPTIERENIDLQDPYVSIWNKDLLIVVGKIVRLIYDRMIVEMVNNESKQIDLILSMFAFQTSVPNNDIGHLMQHGFFLSDADILVPVQQSLSENQLSLISYRKAFLSTSIYLQTFVSFPLVPFDIGHNEFFKMLKRHEMIREIDPNMILNNIRESVLSIERFVGLLRWLCTDTSVDRSFIKQIFAEISYRETDQSSIIQLEKIEYYNSWNIGTLPLPSNILPTSVVKYLSQEDLSTRLFLSRISIKDLIEFYLMNDQHYLFEKENSSMILLSLIGQHWSEYRDDQWKKKIKILLTQLKCIPTTQGMKLPIESYIRSSDLSSDLPIITMFNPKISKNNDEIVGEYSVTIDFLKEIGCRTIHIPSGMYSLSTRSTQSSENDEALKYLIEDLLKKRKTMSDADIDALKNNPSLIGTTLKGGTTRIKRKYKPNELHFPSVALSLEWDQLPIIDWIQIEQFSPEYRFLKELGVREAPELNELIFHIVQEHFRTSRKKSDYQLPRSLIFLAENFRKHYYEQWKTIRFRTAFLPSCSPDKEQSEDILLTIPNMVFRESGPICPSLLPDVLQMFSQFIDISLLGIKYRPTVETALNILMEKRYKWLTDQSAPIYFSYLNKLEGLNSALIEKLAHQSFIPVPGYNNYLKPCQVFIRSSANFNQNIFDNSVSHGLIDYVDYGSEANSFLSRIGVLPYPSVEGLADLLIERQSSYFASTEENTDEVIAKKICFYTHCLKQLAAVPNIVQRLKNEPLKSRLFNKSWCLAYQTVQRSNGNKGRIFKIARPIDVFLDDDHQSAIDLQPLCAPDEPELTKLYEIFGSKWLSEVVKRTLIHTGRAFRTDRSEQLLVLIQHRLDMLFVNNRGELLDQMDDRRIALLRNKLSVYETDGIQCHLSFQYRTITLNATECSSCAVEQDTNGIHLYIQKDIPTIDYVDIATELTRFVHQKPLHSLIYAISEKLASPLETLKRRGIPVDRLLKTIEQQPIKLLSRIEHEKTSSNISSSIRHTSSYTMNSIERISHFGHHQLSHEVDIDRIIRTSRPYFHKEFRQVEQSREETNNLCEYVPASNMIRYHLHFNGISLYIDHNINVTTSMTNQAQHLTRLLSGLAKQVFYMSESVMHLFRDTESARIAFNSNGSLFFNLRYFEQVFADDLRIHLSNVSSSRTIVHTIVNFYYIITCHELAHNLRSNHDLNFINHFEQLLAKFMDAKEMFLNEYSFQ